MTHSPAPRGNCGCTTPPPAGITLEGEGSTPPQQPRPAPSRNQTPPDESRRIIHRPQCLPEIRISPAQEELSTLKRLTRQPRSNIRAIAGIRHTTGTISLCHNQQRRSRARGDKPDQYYKEHYGYKPPRPRGNPPRSPASQNRTGQPVSAYAETNPRLIGQPSPDSRLPPWR